MMIAPASIAAIIKPDSHRVVRREKKKLEMYFNKVFMFGICSRAKQIPAMNYPSAKLQGISPPLTGGDEGEGENIF